MKKIIIIPDSFKGTMSSIEVCDIVEERLRAALSDCEILSIPVADGGEGTVQCFHKALGGELITVRVSDAFAGKLDATYLRAGDMAVIEMAAAAGMISNQKRDSLTATTYGVGEMIAHAIDHGCRQVLIGLGGSCTNDAGTGMAAALGARFTDEAGEEFLPAGGSLSRIAHIDMKRLRDRLEGIRICCMCDVKSPLYGPDGAAYVFAPQKGADSETVKVLDENLKAFAATVKENLSIDISKMPGGGAAGGMGAGCFVFLNAELKPGIEMVLDTVNFDSLLENCYCIITGEGRIDEQSMKGKVISGITRRAVEKDVPVVAVVGSVEGDEEKIRSMGLSKLYVTTKKGLSDEEIRLHCREFLADTMEQLIREL